MESKGLSSRSSRKAGGNSGVEAVKKQVVRNPRVPVPVVEIGRLDDGALSDETSARPLSNRTTTSQSKSSEKTASKHERVKRVNIPFGEKKYRGLVELGSLENALVEERRDESTRRVCLRNRDPEPCLSDHYAPEFSAEFVFTFPQPPPAFVREYSHQITPLSRLLTQIYSSDSD